MAGRICDPIARWVYALARLDESEGPLTAWAMFKREGDERGRTTPGKRVVAMRRAGLVELVPDNGGRGWKRWRITPKGREWLREALYQMNEFLRGES